MVNRVNRDSHRLFAGVPMEEATNGTLLMSYVHDFTTPTGLVLADIAGTDPATGAARYYYHDNIDSTRRLRGANKASLAQYEFDPYGLYYAVSGAETPYKWGPTASTPPTPCSTPPTAGTSPCKPAGLRATRWGWLTDQIYLLTYLTIQSMQPTPWVQALLLASSGSLSVQGKHAHWPTII